MKSKLLPVMALLVAVPGLAFAQSDSCPGCVIGIYNDEGLRKNYGNFGDFATFSDTLYIGIRYDPGSTFDALTGIEFSLQGVPQTGLPATYPIRDGGFSVGPPTPVAPADTINGTGGWNVVWQECQPGNKVLVEIIIVSFGTIPSNTVIRVLHKYPPLEPTLPNVLFTQCDFPNFTKTTVRGGCYVLNPTVGPGESVGDPPCRLETDAVASRSWSRIKGLYR